MSTTTDWINAGGSVLSGATALVALIVATRAYYWSRRQRPRPIVIAQYVQSLGAFNEAQPVKLQNVGNSPAFDITIPYLKLPGKTSHVLKTETIRFIRDGEWADTRHVLEPDDQPMRPGMSYLQTFAALLQQHFNKPGRAFEHPDSIPFTVCFKSIEGERFSVQHRFVIDAGFLNQARVELDQSLLS